jgi:intraflagellar transport protein 122
MIDLKSHKKVKHKSLVIAETKIFILAFNDAGFKKEAIRVLEELTLNAVIENRFNDAGYYYWLLSNEYLQIAGGIIIFILIKHNSKFYFKTEEKEVLSQSKMIERFEQFQRLSEIYYAYHNIHRFVVCYIYSFKKIGFKI